MPNYQIKLTPVDTFYFGADKHGTDLKINYFVESKSYPQQTTMLGMLRYYLLFRSSNLIFAHLDPNEIAKRKTAAKQLIGVKSFSFKGENDFSKIKSICPLYFIKDKQVYHIAPFDLEYELSLDNVLKKERKNFSSKKHSKDISELKLIAANQNVRQLSSILNTEKQVGNKIVKPGSNNKEGFYKMHKKKFKGNWSFAFDADIDMDIPDNESNFVPFGGEKSIFEIRLTKRPLQQQHLPQQYVRKKPYVFLTSDAFVDNQSFTQVEFAVNQFASFRCLSSTVDNTTHYNDLPRNQSKTHGLTLSKRCQLLQRGSTLYFKSETDRDAFTNTLKTTSGTNIGFNQFLTN